MKSRSQSKGPRPAAPSPDTSARGPQARGPGQAGPRGLEGAQDLVGNAAMLDLIRSQGRGPAGAEGEEMELPYRAEMEEAFGEDLSGVSVSAGPQAAQDTAAIGAEAFALVDQIVFGKQTPSKDTVAHEVAHVVQQRRAGQAAVQPKTTSTPSDAAEQEADAAASAVSAGQKADVSEAPSASIAMKSSTVGIGAGMDSAGTELESTGGGGSWGELESGEAFDLGTSEAWGTGLSTLFGGAVDTIIPADGDEGQISLKVMVPVGSIGIAATQVGIEFELGAKRSSKVELSGSFEFKAKVGAEVEKFAEIFLEAGLAGFVEAKGDSAVEAFELLRWRFWEMLITVSPELGLELFDFDHTLDTIRNMNAGDQVTTGAEVSVEFGLDIGDDDLGGSGELGYSHTFGTTRGRDDDGSFIHQEFSEDKFEASFEVGPVGLDIDVKQKVVDGVLEETSASLVGSVEVAGAALVGTLAEVDFFLQAADALKDMAATLADAVGEDRARTIGSLGDWLQLSGGPEFTQQISQQLATYEGLSNKVTWKLGLDLGGGTAGFSGSLSLQRETEVAFDHEIADVELEASAKSLDTIAEWDFDKSGKLDTGDSIWKSYASNTRGGFTGRLLDAIKSSKLVSDVLTQGDAEGNVNRAEAATIAGRALDLDQSLPDNKIAYFSDVPEGQWYFEPAHAARRHGLFKGGDGTNKFMPANTLSEGEADTVVGRSSGGVQAIEPSEQVQGTEPVLAPINALASLAEGASGYEEIAAARDEVQNLPAEAQAEAYRQIAASVSYRNQRDNEGTHTDGDYMCNMTTIAMVLNQLGIGADESEEQLEDQLDEQLQADYDYPADTLAANPRYSPDARAAWLQANSGVEVSKITPDSSSATAAQTWFETTLLPLLEQGAGATMGTPNSATFLYNHIVRIQWVEAEGLRVDDPFGTAVDLGGYYGYALNAEDSNEGAGARGADNLWTWEMLATIKPSYVQVYSK